MPSTNKRINLTVPDDIYQRILAYKQENGILSDTGACYQLIIQQLNANDQQKLMLEYLKNSSLDELQKISSEGMKFIKDNLP